MDPQKQEKYVFTEQQYSAFKRAASIFLVLGACLLCFFYGIPGIQLDEGKSAFWIITILLLTCVGPVLLVYYWVRPRVIAEESYRATEASVINKRTEKVKGGTGSSDPFGLFLELGLNILASVKGYDQQHIITIQFMPIGPEKQQVTLDVEVSKTVFENLVPGTSTTVRYAIQNPRIAYVQDG